MDGCAGKDIVCMHTRRQLIHTRWNLIKRRFRCALEDVQTRRSFTRELTLLRRPLASSLSAMYKSYSTP